VVAHCVVRPAVEWYGVGIPTFVEGREECFKGFAGELVILGWHWGGWLRRRWRAPGRKKGNDKGKGGGCSHEGPLGRDWAAA
jgi:hypothetical protein